jgi:hypothetical protein
LLSSEDFQSMFDTIAEIYGDYSQRYYKSGDVTLVPKRYLITAAAYIPDAGAGKWSLLYRRAGNLQNHLAQKMIEETQIPTKGKDIVAYLLNREVPRVIRVWVWALEWTEVEWFL